MNEEDIKEVGYVGQYNKSLYVLVPVSVAKDLGIQKGTRWLLHSTDIIDNGAEKSVTYHFRVQPTETPQNVEKIEVVPSAESTASTPQTGPGGVS